MLRYSGFPQNLHAAEHAAMGNIITPGTGLVLIGDSITAQGTTAAQGKYNNHGWWCHTMMILGWPLRVLSNAAVSGRTAEQVLAGFDAEVAPLRPSWVFGIIGQNNVGDADGGAAAIAAIQQIVSKANNIGARLVLGTVTPRTAGNMSATVKANIIAINTAIRALERAGSCVVFDSCAALTDPASADGASKSGLQYDTIHPNAAGAALIGRVAASVLSGKLPAFDSCVQGNHDSRLAMAASTQLLANPKCSGSGGTAGTAGSGTIAASWLLGRQSGSALTVVGSKVVETGPKQREWQRMAFSGTLGGVEYVRFQQSVTLASLLAPITPGTTTIYARCSLRNTSTALAATLQYVRLYVEFLNSVPANVGNGVQGMADSGYQSAFFPTAESRVETQSIVVPETTVTVRLTLNVAFAAGAASGELDATDFELVIE